MSVFIVLSGAQYEGYWPDEEEQPIRSYSTRQEAEVEAERRRKEDGSVIYFSEVFEIQT